MVPVEWVDAAEKRPSAVDEAALKLHEELQPSPQVENPALSRTLQRLGVVRADRPEGLALPCAGGDRRRRHGRRVSGRRCEAEAAPSR